MSLKKHISLIALATLTSNLLLNKSDARVIPLSDEVGSKSEDPYYFLANPNKDATKTPDGTYVETFKIYRDELELSWKPYFAKDTKSQKEKLYKVTHIYKKVQYADGKKGSQFVLLLEYSTARAQILNAIELTQKLLSFENNDLLTLQLYKTYKDNNLIEQKISILTDKTDKEDKSFSLKKEVDSSTKFFVENIKDKDGKILKVITYKNLPIELIN